MPEENQGILPSVAEELHLTSELLKKTHSEATKRLEIHQLLLPLIQTRASQEKGRLHSFRRLKAWLSGTGWSKSKEIELLFYHLKEVNRVAQTLLENSVSTLQKAHHVWQKSENELDIYALFLQLGIDLQGEKLAIHFAKQLGIPTIQHLTQVGIEEVGDLKNLGLYRTGMRAPELIQNMKHFFSI
jgi:hypothetical protein